MKSTLALLAFLAVAATSALGAPSVAVAVKFERDQYIIGEDVTAKVEITNFSGQTLSLAGEPVWLTFSIEGDSQRTVSQRGPAPAQEQFELESAMKATYRANLAPLFDLAQQGRYRVRATVRIPKLQMAVDSSPVSFNVISGAVVWEQDFGTPPPKDAVNTAPEIRKYALLRVRHDREQLYFRLSDARTGKVHHVLHIGPYIAFAPTSQLDQWSNLHVLYQNDARSFLYTMISPDGARLGRETYDLDTTRPRLEPQKNGQIKVSGGIRRFRSDDLPPSIARVAAEPTLPDAPSAQP